jgi:prepilin-type N-terminal cleavage/methylation domain-containing protein
MPTSAARTSPARNSGGVTLIELLAALAILALLVTLVRSGLDRATPRWRLRAAAHQIENIARFAQNAAISRGATAQLFYDVSANSYWVRRSGDEEPVLAVHDLPEGVRFDEVSFADGRRVVTEVAMLRAYDDGTLDFHRVILTAPGGGRARLSFQRLTGEMEYEEVAEDAEFR